ncbi:triphosphoribosyl-dephospho-CoA synthase [Arboricoccus pini]|uniref:Triphosphoribosyl-dephospho-CoA synthase n=1 Tax=Arboricoccus pini TaxID=1963835 RepID=A0A212RZY8_9PROT|nr:triphosphoribosyl-dephospho-CoA synthase [Arboricoccus pini]SNB78399.1 triphosphoribosyl-dephospho-CoA synthase [Arboricoccus pini]
MTRIEAAFEAACLAELQALKPGNVHRWADGHRMTLDDFARSAKASAPAIGEAGATVGQRILEAVKATRAAVGQNTNLGILLLCAPLAKAAEMAGDLDAGLKAVLASLDEADAQAVYAAIRLANPGGLGETPEEDVHSAPKLGLVDAMRLAAGRDRIAWNYANDFSDVLGQGRALLQRLERRGWTPEWALTGVYMGFLSRQPDTHVARKHGQRLAEIVRIEAADLGAELLAASNPAAFEAALLTFDTQLKRRQINPGTSADLTVAVRFAASLAG